MADTVADTPKRVRRTQAERRAESRQALLAAAAAHLSHGGYANLNLDDVAADAGYTRGALYYQFPNKQALALAAIDREYRYWQREVGAPALSDPDPAHALVELARNNAIFCRRPVARLIVTLRHEFHDRSDPIGDVVHDITDKGIAFFAALITSAQDSRAISSITDPHTLATALFGTLEGIAMALANQPPHDEQIAQDLTYTILNPPQRPT
jgi:AcrR family transcriptional regulator